MIKWILFDQAGVQTKNLFKSKPEYEYNGKKFSAKSLEDIFNTDNYKRFSLGKIDETEMIEEFLKENKLPLSVHEYKHILKSTIIANEGMHELLSNLKENYKLAALINEGKEWAQYKLDIPGFRKYFDKIIISGEIGLKKPHADFFEKSLTIIDAKPNECVFIDDAEANCKAAESLGIKSIVFKDAEQLKSELRKYNMKLN